MKGDQFAKWMDKSKVSIEEAAELFGSSEQTIYNWRSTRGVPNKKDAWVRQMMDKHEAVKSRQLPDRLTLEYTPEQFDNWNKAALEKGQITREWATDTLDAAARAAEQKGLYNSRHAAPPEILAREKDPDQKN